MTQLTPSSLYNGCIVSSLATTPPLNPTPPSGILPWNLEPSLQIPDISHLQGVIGGSPPPPGGALGRRSLWLGRSDAPVNDRLGIVQRQREGWRPALVLPTPTPVPTPEPERGGNAGGTVFRGTEGVSSDSFQEPRFHYPHPVPNSAPRPKDSVEKAAEGWQGWPPIPEPQQSKSPISPQEIRYPNSTQGFRIPRAPNSRD